MEKKKTKLTISGTSKKTINNIECDLWEKCNHQWIYDDWANFDDKTKYLCKICGCYRNQYWYRRR